jgi:hypothetical protein
MFDHIGVVVSDFAKSKAFYAQALAPIGHSRVVEIWWMAGASRARASAMRTARISGSARANRRDHFTLLSVSVHAQRSMLSMQQRWPRAARTTASRACARNTTRTTTVHMYWIRTATTSRPSVTTRPTMPDRLDAVSGGGCREAVLEHAVAATGRAPAHRVTHVESACFRSSIKRPLWAGALRRSPSSASERAVASGVRLHNSRAGARSRLQTAPRLELPPVGGTTAATANTETTRPA